jgi:hypothetical protein
VTITPANIGRLVAAVGRRVRAIAARFAHPTTLKMRDDACDLSHPEFYGLSARHDFASVVKERSNKRDVAPEQGNAQVYLPIGPSCC